MKLRSKRNSRKFSVINGFWECKKKNGIRFFLILGYLAAWIFEVILFIKKLNWIILKLSWGEEVLTENIFEFLICEGSFDDFICVKMNNVTIFSFIFRIYLCIKLITFSTKEAIIYICGIIYIFIFSCYCQKSQPPWFIVDLTVSRR